ncbi:uncharacterized protein LOC110189468 [Drosophila serrata]|uniref:uncharacterized protein LOC110189468 n=1 Tax=Drosophila serrata TaxID=7274 RepID=UPI000A1D1704|nr:uncharacterized protein LOC110189468 [Drosophila serrata]
MRFLVTIAAALCLFVAFAAGQQYFLGQFPSRARFGFPDPLTLAQPSATQVRDPRQNRGPVVFPPSPPDAVDESSGVVVGASGYGFVPPQQTTAAVAVAEDPTFFSTTFQSPDTAYATYNFFGNPYTTRFRYF